jgi:hypothetical protein
MHLGEVQRRYYLPLLKKPSKIRPKACTPLSQSLLLRGRLNVYESAYESPNDLLQIGWPYDFVYDMKIERLHVFRVRTCVRIRKRFDIRFQEHATRISRNLRDRRQN